MTRFEQRRRKIRFNSRSLVAFGTMSCPQLITYLETMELDIVGAAIRDDPVVADWIDWWNEEWTKYGPYIRPGLATLYWIWNKSYGGLDADIYAMARDRLAATIPPMVLDGELLSGRTIVQEFIWWSAGEWLFCRHLIEAMDEFVEHYEAGKMADWRRKARRRTASVRRRMIKKLYSLREAA
jgi:hypothetical protein